MSRAGVMGRVGEAVAGSVDERRRSAEASWRYRRGKILVFARSVKGEPLEFGPFERAETAERCLVALARRRDVRVAWSIPADGVSEGEAKR